MAGNAGMEKLILMANRLQHAFSQLSIPCGLDLPQIAVIGGQSAGKSSVLESFVGRDFLPRGAGIVTRRPLILQLITSQTEFGTFLHLKGQHLTDFTEIRREIERETDRLTGHNKNISSVPIHLRIFSPQVLNLTLIDLPGMTRVPIGDQPKDIEKQIREMIVEFVKRENCLILAVSPANADLANSDALKIAKEVDPAGLRTIGVITKLDLMDEGTDAREIFENKLLPLRRGYVGVVSRSQKDIDGSKDVYTALESERRFFQSHPSYKHMADRMGTPYLQQILNQQLIQHIRQVLPNVRERIHRQMTSLEKEIADYQLTSSDDPAKRMKIMLFLTQQFSCDFERVIEGAAVGNYEVNTNELSGGARINRLFHERFAYEMVRTGFEENELRREIAFAIRNIHGVRVGLFTPDKAFEAIVRTQIVKLREPALRCVELVVAELQRILHELGEKLAVFPRLREEVEKFVTHQTRERERITKNQVKLMIDIELAYMNTNHDDFIGFQSPVPTTPAQPGTPGAAATANSQLQNQSLENPVIRKGYLGFPKSGGFMRGARDQWFVLMGDELTWYNDMSEVDRKFTLSTKGLKYFDLDAGFLSRKPVVALCYPDGRSVYKGNKQLELSCANPEEMDRWRTAFSKAGIEALKMDVKNKVSPSASEADQMDPQLERQVDIIRNLVESYMRIVSKNVRDAVPKIIVHLLISEMKRFIHSELLSGLYTSASQDDLMAESVGATQRRQAAIATHEACSEALRIISDVAAETITPSSSTVAPSVDWQKALKSTIQSADSAVKNSTDLQFDLFSSMHRGGRSNGVAGSGPAQEKPPPIPLRTTTGAIANCAVSSFQVQQAAVQSGVLAIVEQRIVTAAKGATPLSIAFGDKEPSVGLRLPLPLTPKHIAS